MAAYYNEFDPYAAQWLRNLIAAGHLPAGDVDDRSIDEVSPDDLRPYAQCHFFAGIGGWPYALRLAGWPDERPVWTGSCPCQPFSVAGKGAGTADERHLWPVWFNLIRECRPSVVFGEQVEAAIRHGWLDLVQADLEGEGYRVGAAGLPAACVGAPHIRQRLWFVADRIGQGLEGHARHGDDAFRRAVPTGPVASGGGADAMADTVQPGRPERGPVAGSGQTPWSSLAWIPCRDGKARPTQPGLFPLAYGVSNRVGRLRAYGNAIVPQVAAAFIAAYQEGISDE